MSEIIQSLQDISPFQRLRVYRRLIKCFENNDCDTLDECLGVDQVFDDAMLAEYPERDAE